MHNATWAKLNSGEWGARIERSTVVEGDLVRVVRKDGKVADKVVSRVIWTGRDVTLAAVADVTGSRPAPRLSQAEIDRLADEAAEMAVSEAALARHLRGVR